MTEDKELIEALSKVEQTVGHTRTTRGALPDFKTVCENYRSVRPMLEKALPLIEKVPLYGGKIATAIRFLMAVANVACPADKPAT